MSIPPRIVVVDDVTENVEVLAKCLSDAYTIQYALSGPESLELVRQASPDLILLDVMMPGMDGYEVNEALKQDPETREIPVIFVTAKGDADSESRALAAGAADFIHKPVNRDVVRARVRMHLALRRRERELEAANAELGRLNAELAAFNDELERRVEERAEALRDSMLLAQAAQRSRHLFLANVSHELRTPMNAIVGLSSLLASRTNDPELRERSDKIGRAGRQLLRIVEDIIDIADLQAGKIGLDSNDFDLRVLLDAALEVWRERAADKGLSLEREIDSALPPFLRGDARRIGQILDNLLGNAVKFSERGRIVLRCRRTGELGHGMAVRFEVEDQGIGIEPERQQTVFDIFEQADNSLTRRVGGVGLGLAICKQLVALMRGKIGVHSAPGLGSLFWIALPLELGIGPDLSMLAAVVGEAGRERAEKRRPI